MDKVIHKKDVNKLKSQYASEYDINTRYFNSLRITLDGKVSSVLALAKDSLNDSKMALKKATHKLKSILKTQDFYDKKAKLKPLTEYDLIHVNKIHKMLWYARQTSNPHIFFGGRKQKPNIVV